MTAKVRFRDSVRRYLPQWLSDRTTSGRTVGFRLIWSMVAPLDVALEHGVQGLKASWPGVGTPTALPYIGRSRGFIRGQSESDASFATRLLGWLDRWRIAGSDEAVARAIQEYVTGAPRVRIFRRDGNVLTLTSGVVTRTTCTWQWDTTSHPERAGNWSEIWIVVYSTPFSTAGNFLHTTGSPTWGIGDGFGIGHDVSRQDYEALKSLLAQWKSQHTRIRAVVWTSDSTLFDPASAPSLPNGSWGGWGGVGSGSRTASSRNLTTCRYWELR